jgi:hypothetical protein
MRFYLYSGTIQTKTPSINKNDKKIYIKNILYDKMKKRPKRDELYTKI